MLKSLSLNQIMWMHARANYLDQTNKHTKQNNQLKQILSNKTVALLMLSTLCITFQKCVHRKC